MKRILEDFTLGLFRLSRLTAILVMPGIREFFRFEESLTDMRLA